MLPFIIKAPLMNPNIAVMGVYDLSRRQKRLLVRGRLTESDAAKLSDRAIARELGVSQPFVSAQRRLVCPSAGTESCQPQNAHVLSHRHVAENVGVPERASDRDVLGGAWRDPKAESVQGSQERARAFLDNTPRATWVQRHHWLAHEGPCRALSDGDPFE